MGKNKKLLSLLSLLFLAIAFILFYYFFLQYSNRPSDNKKSVIQEEAEDNLSDKYDLLYNQAEIAIIDGDERSADFRLARYFNWAVKNNEVSQALDNITPLLKDYKLSSPTSFISGKYDSKFISWFVSSTYEMWDFNEENQDSIMEDDITFQLAGIKDDKYFAIIFGSRPYVEGWNLISDESQQVAILILGDTNEEKLYLAVGEIGENNNEATKTNGKIEIELGGFLQHIWQPEFFDLENDGIPEVWVRYNTTTADGFMQELAIYKTKNDGELYLFKRFTGNAEGIARRINNNQIEVGEGVAGDARESHLNFSKFRFTVWEFRNGSFLKKSEEITPHILLSDKWKEYYEINKF